MSISLPAALMIAIAVFCSLLTVNAVLLWSQVRALRIRPRIVTVEPVRVPTQEEALLHLKLMRDEALMLREAMALRVGQCVELMLEDEPGLNGTHGTIAGFEDNGQVSVDVDCFDGVKFSRNLLKFWPGELRVIAEPEMSEDEADDGGQG